MEQKEFFSTICFLALMQDNMGLADKAPSYIKEKIVMLKMGEEAFGFLDVYNQKTVMDYCLKWKVEIPEKVKECYQREIEARKKLGLMGL